MELEHRFEVPVGIDKAWATLLDMGQVGPCFPGASLDSVDGDEFTGTVKVKLGPIQLTYQGKAKITEKDEAAHRATIEASGNATRSSSTATMAVMATATELAADRTAVDLRTTLSITGRPAQFGRGVMAEVGNKLIGQFADCVSHKLAGEPEPAAATADAPAAQTDAASPTASGAAAPAGTAQHAEGVAAHRIPEEHGGEAIDLIGSAGLPIAKRLLPILLGLIAVLVIRKLLRGHGSADGETA